MIHVGGTRLFSTVLRSRLFLSCTFLELAHRVHATEQKGWGKVGDKKRLTLENLGEVEVPQGSKMHHLWMFGLLVVQLGIACAPTPYNKMQSWRLRRRWRLVWCVGACVSMEPWHPFASKKLYISWVIWQVPPVRCCDMAESSAAVSEACTMYLYRYTYIKSAWISIDI